jgi:hypothetical protein
VAKAQFKDALHRFGESNFNVNITILPLLFEYLSCNLLTPLFLLEYFAFNCVDISLNCSARPVL